MNINVGEKIRQFVRKEPVTSVSFVLAPFITNDVSLITFVPFSIFILEMANLREYMIPILSLQEFC